MLKLTIIDIIKEIANEKFKWFFKIIFIMKKIKEILYNIKLINSVIFLNMILLMRLKIKLIVFYNKCVPVLCLNRKWVIYKMLFYYI